MSSWQLTICTSRGGGGKLDEGVGHSTLEFRNNLCSVEHVIAPQEDWAGTGPMNGDCFPFWVYNPNHSGTGIQILVNLVLDLFDRVVRRYDLNGEIGSAF